MKTLPLIAWVMLLALVAGCSTVDSRIGKAQSQFDSWPAAVQEKIRAGQIDVGFTPEQVRVALGEPQKKYTRTTESGSAEVWAYAARGSGFSIGLGVGAGRGSSAYGGGVAYDTSRYGGDDERVRVIFEDGQVASVEERTR